MNVYVTMIYEKSLSFVDRYLSYLILLICNVIIYTVLVKPFCSVTNVGTNFVLKFL